MMYVAAIAVVFLAAGLAMLSKLGKGNSAALELAVARATGSRKAQAPRDFCMQQFDEAVSSRH